MHKGAKQETRNRYCFMLTTNAYNVSWPEKHRRIAYMHSIAFPAIVTVFSNYVHCIDLFLSPRKEHALSLHERV